MTTKFNIFCDEGTSSQPNEQPGKLGDQLHQNDLTNKHMKREPLGLRQTHVTSLACQPQQQVHIPSSQTSQTNLDIATTGTSTQSGSSNSDNDEDQENDISMASLGSDFVPSILHESDVYDDSILIEEDAGVIGDDDFSALLADDELLSSSCDNIIDDIEQDEEFKLELSQAFKQHDESQLFKSTVYIHDIEAYLYDLEREPDLRPIPNYMDFQESIDSKKRSILLNWLVEVSDEYRLESETFFLCISLLDRFLSTMSVTTDNFQLLGVTCLFIASKYEEIYPPNLCQLVEVTDDTYSGKQIRLMEQEILKALDYRISIPTISFFLRRIFAFNKFPKRVFYMAEYLCYLAVMDEQPFLEYYPSEIAIAAVILAANQLNAASNISNELRNEFNRSQSNQLSRRNLPEGIRLRDVDRRSYIIGEDFRPCILALWEAQSQAYSKTTKQASNHGVVLKFSQVDHGSVAVLPPPHVNDLLSY